MKSALRRLVRTRPLVAALTAGTLVATAATALAVTENGDGTLVGCSAAGTTQYCTTATGAPNDTLNAGRGDDTVWGLAGSDTINVGGGNDMIDGDGHCPQKYEGQVFPNGIKDTDQCSHGRTDSPSQHDTINVNGGMGNDTIFSGGGTNTINANNPGGNDTVYAGPIGDLINMAQTGQSDNKIFLPHSVNGSTVHDGNGGGVIHAQNGVKDTITCQPGNTTTVYADQTAAWRDSVTGCAHVIYNKRDPTTNPYPARDRAVARKATHRSRTTRKHHTRKHTRKHTHAKARSFTF